MFLDLNYSYELPQELVYVRLDELFGASAMSIAIIVRRRPHPVDGHFVIVHTSSIAKAYLGCVVDKSGRIIEWIDICVQSFSKASIPALSYHGVNNLTNDKIWSQWCQSVAAQDHGFILSGFEQDNPCPVVINKTANTAGILRRNGAVLVLCKDDKLLTQECGRPYSAGRARYLYDNSQQPCFIKVVDELGVNCEIARIGEVFNLTGADDCVLFNSACGKILLRRHDDLSLTELIDVYNHKLSAEASISSMQKISQRTDGAMREVCELFLNNKSASKKNREILHLRAVLFNQMLQVCLDVTQRLSRPLLNLSAESWRIKTLTARHLPLMWSVEPILVDNGDVITSEHIGANAGFFLPADISRISIYQPDIMNKMNRGSLSLRMLDITCSDDVSVFGTIDCSDDLDAYPNGVININFDLSDCNFVLYARFVKGAKSVANQWEFYAENLKFNEKQISLLTAAKGVLITNVDYNIWPHLNIGCDFYSLGILALQIFYTSGKELSYVVDAFAELCKKTDEFNGNIKNRVQIAIDEDKNWFELLKINGLDSVDNIFYRNIWCDIFVMIATLLPHSTKDSIKYGECNVVNAVKQYEKYLRQSKILVNHTRAFIISQWEENEIVRDVVSKIKLF